MVLEKRLKNKKVGEEGRGKKRHRTEETEEGRRRRVKQRRETGVRRPWTLLEKRNE